MVSECVLSREILCFQEVICDTVPQLFMVWMTESYTLTAASIHCPLNTSVGVRTHDRQLWSQTLYHHTTPRHNHHISTTHWHCDSMAAQWRSVNRPNWRLLVRFLALVGDPARWSKAWLMLPMNVLRLEEKETLLWYIGQPTISLTKLWRQSIHFIELVPEHISGTNLTDSEIHHESIESNRRQPRGVVCVVVMNIRMSSDQHRNL